MEITQFRFCSSCLHLFCSYQENWNVIQNLVFTHTHTIYLWLTGIFSVRITDWLISRSNRSKSRYDRVLSHLASLAQHCLLSALETIFVQMGTWPPAVISVSAYPVIDVTHGAGIVGQHVEPLLGQPTSFIRVSGLSRCCHFFPLIGTGQGNK